MADIVLFNPLKLSDEEFDTIAALSALNYSIAQIAVYLEVDFLNFSKAFNEKDSKIKFHFTRGKLEAKFLINQKLLDSAKGGNITASQEYNKIINANEVEQIKRRVLFYED